MFNREYQRRAARQALERIGVGLARDNSGFYRPVKRVSPVVKKCGEKLQGVQLELFAAQPENLPIAQGEQNPDRPLADLFPEAYV